MGLGKTYSTQYLLDSNNNSGVAGQVLSTTSTGIDWADANTLPGAGLWLANGNDIYNSNSGNVGIGITAPTSKLHIGDARNNAILLKDNRTSGSTSTTYDSSITWDAFYADAAKITLSHNDFSTTLRRLHFDIGGNELMSIKANGNVGIGTTSPNSKLNVYDATADTSINVNTGTGGSYPKKTGISFGATSTSLGGDAKFTGGAGIQALNTAASGNPTDLTFWTNSTGTPAERARITSTGHLQVSTGYFELTSQPTTKLWLSTNQVQLYAGNLLVFGGYNASNDSVVIGNESGDVNVTLAGGANDKVLYLEGSSGSVGIGTKTPNEKLDITGGYLKFNGGDYGIKGSASLTYNPVSDHYFMSSGSTKVTIKASGFVGIGTTTFNNYWSGYAVLKLGADNGFFSNITSSTGSALFIAQNVYNDGNVYRYVATNESGLVDMRDGKFSFLTAPSGSAGATATMTNRFTILQGGNVGIGVTVPAVPLDVEGAIRSTNDNSGNHLELFCDGDNTGDSFIRNTGGRIVIESATDETSITTDNSGTGNAILEVLDSSSVAKIKLNSSGDSYLNGGDVGIGDTSPSNKLDVNGDIRATQYNLRGNVSNPTSTGVAIYDQATVGLTFSAHSTELRGWTGSAMARSAFITYNTATFTGTCTATNFILSSDETLKDNVKEIDTKHIDVEWKSFELKSEPGVKRSGVIAQELEEKHPEFVRTDKDGLKSVAYIDLLISKIAELEARLEKAGL